MLSCLKFDIRNPFRVRTGDLQRWHHVEWRQLGVGYVVGLVHCSPGGANYIINQGANEERKKSCKVALNLLIIP
jgi:hypothetical protein